MKALCLLHSVMGLLLLVAGAATLAQEPNAPTLHTGAKLVVVDVVVRDKNQERVRALARKDFSILEGGTRQKIESFEEHSGGLLRQPEPAQALPVGTFTNRLPAPASSAVNIILIDTLNTPLKDQPFLRQQLTDYLGSVQPGTELAVFALNVRLIMLQGFTSDPLILKHSLDRALVERSVMLSDAQEQNSPDETIMDTIADLGMDRYIPKSTQIEMLNNENRFKASRTESRSKLLLDGLDVLARYLEGIPGRKNLMWFSGSFPISTQPNKPRKFALDEDYDAFAKMTNSEHEFRETVNLMARSQVAVYPIDSRGLMTSSAISSASKGIGLTNPLTFADYVSDFSESQQDEHGTMDRIARETGGQAFYNTNGLADAMRSAVDDGAAYYTLTYKPSNTNWNGELRKIAVQLQQRGYALTYRHSYYANDANSPKSALVKTATDAGEVPHHGLDDGGLTRSMEHGVPISTQIGFRARIQPKAGFLDAAAAQANLPESPEYLHQSGSFRKVAVSFQVEPGSLTLLKAADGTYSGLIELSALGYNRDGRIVAKVAHPLQIKVSAQNYEQFMRVVTPLQLELGLPAQGNYSVRTGIEDLNSQRVGTLEVPFDLVKDLPALPAGEPIAAPKLTPRSIP